MLTTRWEFYFLKQFIRIFFLFLCCFYGLYILIDYASHASNLTYHKIQIPWQDAIRYYFFVFSSRLEILFPLSLLIALVHTICMLNVHNELIAFMASGFSPKILIRPFIALGLLGVFFTYINEQFFLPEALRNLRRIEDSIKHQKSRHPSTYSARSIRLEDGSLLVFQDYDTNKERFFDTYWVQSIDNIYRIKYLFPTFPNPTGYFVDHLVRQENGELLQEAAYQTFTFSNMKLNPEVLQSTIIDPDILPLTKLWEQFFEVSSSPNEKESKILSAFYWKIMMPWLCLLTIIAPVPFCIKFSRSLPLFLTYSCNLFGLIAFYMFMDAAQVVAKRQVIPPFWAICAPFLIALSYFGWRFAKIESS